MVAPGGLRISEQKFSFKNFEKKEKYVMNCQGLGGKNRYNSEKLSFFNLFLLSFITATLW